MALDNANDEFDDELLSAYVDDELTAEQRAAVEERLRSDPEAARLIEEFRALSNSLKAMPRESLGYELGPAVEAAVDRKRIALARHTVDPDGPPIADRGFKRGFVWATIAVAATLLLAFVAEEEQPAVREVANVEPQRRPATDGAGRPFGEMRAPAQPDDSSLAVSDSAPQPAEPASPPPLSAAAREDPGSQPSVGLYAATEASRGSREGAESPRSAAPAANVAERPKSPATELGRATTSPAPPQGVADAIAPHALTEPDSGSATPEVTFVELVTEAPDPLQQLTLTLQSRGIAVEDEAKAGSKEMDLRAESETARSHLAKSEQQAAQGETESSELRYGMDLAASMLNFDAESRREFAAQEGVLIEGSLESVAGVLDEFVPKKQPWISEVRVHREGQRVTAGAPIRAVPLDGFGYYRTTDAGGLGGAAGRPQSFSDAAPVETPEIEGRLSGSQAGEAPLPASSGVARQEAKQTLARARRLQINELTDPERQSLHRSAATGAGRLEKGMPQEAQLIIYFTKPSDAERSAAPAR